MIRGLHIFSKNLAFFFAILTMVWFCVAVSPRDKSITLFLFLITISLAFIAVFTSFLIPRGSKRHDEPFSISPVTQVFTIAIAILLILAVALPSYRGSGVRRKYSRSKKTLRELTAAIGEYKKEKGVFPASLFELTTPVAYIEAIDRDPFNDHYQYHTDGGRWFLCGAGPDRDSDLDPSAVIEGGKEIGFLLQEQSYDPTNGTRSNGDMWRYGPR